MAECPSNPWCVYVDPDVLGGAIHSVHTSHVSLQIHRLRLHIREDERQSGIQDGPELPVRVSVQQEEGERFHVHVFLTFCFDELSLICVRTGLSHDCLHYQPH